MNEQPRVLSLFSAPLVAPDGTPLAALDIEAEREAIIRELTACNRQIVLRWAFATIDELAQGIEDRFNILHFSGHGHPEFLLFEDGKGGSSPVRGDFLKKLIGSGGPFELAIVSACHSEEIGKLLLEAGVRHVVAIRCAHPVLDRAAIEFVGQFFRKLFRGKSIQAAFDYAKLLVEANPDLAKAKPLLEAMAIEEGKPYVPEEKKFVLLPESDPSFHTANLVEESVPEGSLTLESPSLAKSNLLVRPRTFVGRSREMHAVINRLFTGHITTIKATGGMGKTTLAVEAARWFQARGTFPDGIYHVDIRQAETIGGVIAALGAALGAALQEEMTEPADVVRVLRDKQCLLLLDNAEEVLWRDEDSARNLIDQILKKCPRVRLLITSQRDVGGGLARTGNGLPPLSATERRSADALADVGKATPAARRVTVRRVCPFGRPTRRTSPIDRLDGQPVDRRRDLERSAGED